MQFVCMHFSSLDMDILTANTDKVFIVFIVLKL